MGFRSACGEDDDSLRRQGRRCVKCAAAKVTKMESKETTECTLLSLGQGVTWNGKQGVVRYIGSATFASGEWVGVELMQENGMHDGTVLGVSYFSCPDKKGIFAQPGQLEPGCLVNSNDHESRRRRCKPS